MNDKRYRAYATFNIYDVEFLIKAAWDCRTRAALVHMNAILELVELECTFTFARIERCVLQADFWLHVKGM